MRGRAIVSLHLPARAKKLRLTVTRSTGCKSCQKRRQRVSRTAALVSGNERCMVATSIKRVVLDWI
jgi:hypothetical protein